jgi:hypothetical protein
VRCDVVGGLGGLQVDEAAPERRGLWDRAHLPQIHSVKVAEDPRQKVIGLQILWQDRDIQALCIMCIHHSSRLSQGGSGDKPDLEVEMCFVAIPCVPTALNIARSASDASPAQHASTIVCLETGRTFSARQFRHHDR